MKTMCFIPVIFTAAFFFCAVVLEENSYEWTPGFSGYLKNVLE
jgi:hypothetical protein